ALLPVVGGGQRPRRARKGRQVEGEAADDGARRILYLDGGGEAERGEIRGGPHREGQLLHARGRRAGRRLLEDVHRVDLALGLSQHVLAPGRLSQHRRRVVALHLLPGVPGLERDERRVQVEGEGGDGEHG